MTLRLAFAEDEADARAKLRRLLSSDVDVQVVGEARNGREAIALVEKEHPDVLLLDIKMPELDGFEVLQTLVNRDIPLPKVVFITAYDEFALEAFHVRALDYLLKPFDGERLSAALERVRTQLELESRPSSAAVESLLANLRPGETPDDVDEESSASSYLERLCVRSAGRMQFVSMSDVDWIEACGNYVRLHTPTGRPLVRATIRHLASRLDPSSFVRIHRSAIVNVGRVREMRSLAAGDSLVTLLSGMRLRVSRFYRPSLDQKLGLRP